MTGLIWTLHRHDEQALHFLVSRRYWLLDRMMRLITHIADPLPAIATVWLIAHSQRGMFALAVSHLFVQLLKRTCCRKRPALPIGVESLVHAPDRFSFPSGHAAAGMTVALALAAALPWPLRAFVLMMGVLVGLSRSYLGVHYPGDVVAGWLLAHAAYLLGGVIL